MLRGLGERSEEPTPALTVTEPEPAPEPEPDPGAEGQGPRQTGGQARGQSGRSS